MKNNIPTTPLTVSGNDDTLFISGNAIHDADGEWICDCMNKQHADLIVTAVNAHEALVEACRVALIEMDRITGDIGFEPERFRERIAVVHALAAALTKAQGAAA